jgi:hypothetical protein
MEQVTIERGPDGDGEPETCMGSLAAEQFDALLPILARHTTSPDGWFLLWDGFGDLNRRVFTLDGPKVAHWAWDFYLLRGPLGSFADSPDDPSSGGPTTARGACAPTSTAAGGTSPAPRPALTRSWPCRCSMPWRPGQQAQRTPGWTSSMIPTGSCPARLTSAEGSQRGLPAKVPRPGTV